MSVIVCMCFLWDLMPDLHVRVNMGVIRVSMAFLLCVSQQDKLKGQLKLIGCKVTMNLTKRYTFNIELASGGMH